MSYLQDYYGGSASGGVNPVLAQTLAKGSFWARFISVCLFLTLLLIFVYPLLVLFFYFMIARNPDLSGTSQIFVMFFLPFLPQAIIYYFLGSSMAKYAKFAKALKGKDISESNVAKCFSCSTTFLKTLGLILTLMLLGILFAAIFPAYKNYILA